jgi:hypothetical protein
LTDRVAPVAFLAGRREVFGGSVEPWIDPQRPFVVDHGAVNIAPFAKSGTTIVVGFVKSRIELERTVIVGVVAAELLISRAAIGVSAVALGIKLDSSLWSSIARSYSILK